MASIVNLGLDINSLVFYLVNFGVVFFIIYYFFSKPISSMLNGRQKIVRDNIDEAEKMKKELIEMKDKYDKEREKMMKELEEKISSSTSAIKLKSDELNKELSEKKLELLKRATKDITEMKSAALNELKDDITKYISDTILDYLKENADKNDIETSVTKSFDQFIKKYE